MGRVQAEALGDVLRHLLNLHAKPAARHMALALEIHDDFPGHGSGDGEADADRAAGGREDGGVDANDLALEVEGRTAGVALVDGGVDLQEIVIGARADLAATGGDDAGGHGAAKAEGIADSDHPVANARILVSELDGGKCLAIGVNDLEQGQIGLGIGADDLGLPGLAVIGLDPDLGGVLDDVVVGDDVTIGRDEEARAHGLALMELGHLAGQAEAAAEVLEELAELGGQAVKAGQLLHESVRVGAGGGLEGDFHRHHGGHDLFDEISEALSGRGHHGLGVRGRQKRAGHARA